MKLSIRYLDNSPFTHAVSIERLLDTPTRWWNPMAGSGGAGAFVAPRTLDCIVPMADGGDQFQNVFFCDIIISSGNLPTGTYIAYIHDMSVTNRTVYKFVFDVDRVMPGVLVLSNEFSYI